MIKKGYAWANGAASILNAIATWKGSAFGIDLKTRAEVELDNSRCIKGVVPGVVPKVNPMLIEHCVELVLKRLGYVYGGTVRTYSEIPVASGLKSSSTVANAVVLATLDALDEEMDHISAAKIGVDAAKDVGVTVTGALDDALASMLGGVVLTDNRKMQLIRREEFHRHVMLLVPDQKLFSKDTNVGASKVIAPLADVAFELAEHGDYGRAMTLNGFAYSVALGLPTMPLIEALKAGAEGVSLSGTGPAYAAIIDEDKMDKLEAAWGVLGGRVIRTKTNNRSASKGQDINGA